MNPMEDRYDARRSALAEKSQRLAISTYNLLPGKDRIVVTGLPGGETRYAARINGVRTRVHFGEE